jgi:hypothetical protein
MGLFITFAVVWSAVWVYNDATKNQIGHGGDSAGKWAAATLIIWILAFPYYLFKRNGLIVLAKNQPMTYPNRKPVLAGLSVFAIVVSYMSLTGAKQQGLPGCDDTEVTQIAKQIISDEVGRKLASTKVKLEIKALTNIVDQGYDKSAGIRVCKGSLLSSVGTNSLLYTVKWKDQSKGLFYVETQVQ